MSFSRTGAGAAAVALSGLALFGLQSPASAAAGDCPVGAHYAPQSGCVDNGNSVDHRNFAPGGKGKIKAPGFKPGSSAELWLHSTPVLLGTFTANPAGEVDADFAMPKDVPAGDHHLEVVGVDASGNPVSFSVPVAVAGKATAAGASASSSGLSDNSTQIVLIAAAGVVLVGAGAGATVLGRRRRTAS